MYNVLLRNWPLAAINQNHQLLVIKSHEVLQNSFDVTNSFIHELQQKYTLQLTI